jgi:hypothetical protein
MNRMCPRPKKGGMAGARGAGGVLIKQEISRQNVTLPGYYTLQGPAEFFKILIFLNSSGGFFVLEGNFLPGNNLWVYYKIR